MKLEFVNVNFMTINCKLNGGIATKVENIILKSPHK